MPGPELIGVALSFLIFSNLTLSGIGLHEWASVRPSLAFRQAHEVYAPPIKTRPGTFLIGAALLDPVAPLVDLLANVGIRKWNDLWEARSKERLIMGDGFIRP